VSESEQLRFAILRVLEEAEDGVADEDLGELVEYYVAVGSRSDIDDELGDLFAIDLIERDQVDERWRLAERGS
jgi:hypothetical protein